MDYHTNKNFSTCNDNASDKKRQCLGRKEAMFQAEKSNVLHLIKQCFLPIKTMLSFWERKSKVVCAQQNADDIPPHGLRVSPAKRL